MTAPDTHLAARGDTGDGANGDGVPGRASLLVAEDCDTNLLIIRLLLEQGGYAPLIATDGVMAVEMTVQHRPKLVLMDISMPKMDGVDAAREIHRRIPDGAPYIVAVTASVTAEQRAECRAAGFIGYIEKPIDAEELLGVVQYIMDSPEPTPSHLSQATRRSL